LVLTQHARIEAQAQEIVALTARIAALESRLKGPAKTPDNSSVPPSKRQKADLPAGRGSGAAAGIPV
jgi:transposase